MQGGFLVENVMRTRRSYVRNRLQHVWMCLHGLTERQRGEDLQRLEETGIMELRTAVAQPFILARLGSRLRSLFLESTQRNEGKI